MNREGWLRAVIIVAAIIGLLLFTRTTFQLVSIVLLGAGVMALGLTVYYRPVAIAGFIVMAVASSAATTIETLTEVRTVLAALFGLLLPNSVLAWIAFTAESEEPLRFAPIRKPFLMGAAYLATCLVAVPATVTVTGFLLPSVSARLQGLAEISIVLMVVTVGAVLLGSRNPREVKAPGREEEAEEYED